MKPLKRIPSQPGVVLSLQLREDLHTLAQLRDNSLMEFFNVRRPAPVWTGTNLNHVPVLFCAYTAESRLKPLVSHVVPADGVVPNARPVPRRMLSAIIEPGGRYGADLVELTDDYEPVKATLVRADLDPVTDRELLYRHELTGMIGDPGKLKKRLLRFFETGVNWDDAKGFLFPSLPLPPPWEG
ncbi:hypothetical protein ACQKGO_09625 [Corallococcus interemptor]|uniref:hypothetical protein n=1 Tax=Corallococcus interemptor TaxID=2316720 RepID=UPI003D0595E2